MIDDHDFVVLMVMNWRVMPVMLDDDVERLLSSGSVEAAREWAITERGVSREAEWDAANDLANRRLMMIMSEGRSRASTASA